MDYVILGIMLLSAAYVAYETVKMKSLGQSPTLQTGPTSEEGVPISVVFGTKQITNPQIAWWGDCLVKDARPGVMASAYLITGPISYNLPPAVVYYASLQFALCHGKLDALKEILIADQPYFSTAAIPQMELTVAGTGLLQPSGCYAFTTGAGAVERYDGDTSDKVLGTLAFDPGAAHLSGVDAGVNDYLAQQMNLPLGPKYYGVATVHTPGRIFFGTNPSLSLWSFLVRRIHTRLGGTVAQWQDSLAEISIGRNREDAWKYKVQTPSDVTSYASPTYDDSAWDHGPGGIGNAAANTVILDYGSVNNYPVPVVRTHVAFGNTYTSAVPAGTKIWLRADLGPLGPVNLNVQCWHDDAAILWFNGTAITLKPTVVQVSTSNPDTSSSDPAVNTYARLNSTAVIPSNLINPNGPNVVAYRVETTDSKYIYAGLQVGGNSSSNVSVLDMNGVHIIRECLTDTFWSPLGYPDAVIDEASFLAAAQTLFNERFGISLHWDQQSPIRDFIDEVLRHISGVLYVDRTAATFKIKLLRNDYTYADLPVLDESHIVKIENAAHRAVAELVNTVTITYSATPRGDKGSVTLQDDGLIDEQGGVVPKKIAYPGVTNQMTASKLSLRDLRMFSAPLLTCTVYADQSAATLNPGDPFVLRWPDLKIAGPVMRVLGIDLGNGIDNTVKIDCAEDVFSFPSQILHATNDPSFPPPTITTDLSVQVVDFYTVQTKDPRDKGTVYGLCTGYYSCPPFAVFAGWTETSGVLTHDSTGLVQSWFSDLDLSVDYTTKRSPAEGKRFLVYHAGASDKQLGGLYILDDAGAHYNDAGDYVNTHAVMRRDPSFVLSSDYSQGMTFFVENGDVYGGKYETLATTGIVLGTTDLDWTLTDAPFPWTTKQELLTLAQLNTAQLDLATLTQTITMAGLPGVASFNGFETLVGSPGGTQIPAGPWVFTVEATWLQILDPVPNGDTYLGFYVFRDRASGAGGGQLFAEVYADLPLTEATGRMQISTTQPAFDLSDGDRLVLIPTLKTMSTHPVEVALIYNSAVHGTYLTMPQTIGSQATSQVKKLSSLVRVSDIALDTGVEAITVVGPQGSRSPAIPLATTTACYISTLWTMPGEAVSGNVTIRPVFVVPADATGAVSWAVLIGPVVGFSVAIPSTAQPWTGDAGAKIADVPVTETGLVIGPLAPGTTYRIGLRRPASDGLASVVNLMGIQIDYQAKVAL